MVATTLKYAKDRVFNGRDHTAPLFHSFFLSLLILFSSFLQNTQREEVRHKNE